MGENAVQAENLQAGLMPIPAPKRFIFNPKDVVVESKQLPLGGPARGLWAWTGQKAAASRHPRPLHKPELGGGTYFYTR